MYFDLSSEVNLNLTYYIIAASNDYPMYNIEDNSVISGVIPGYSKDELVTYGAYVRLVFLLDHRLQGALILEELSMQSTSQSTVTPFCVDHPSLCVAIRLCAGSPSLIVSFEVRFDVV